MQMIQYNRRHQTHHNQEKSSELSKQETLEAAWPSSILPGLQVEREDAGSENENEEKLDADSCHVNM